MRPPLGPGLRVLALTALLATGGCNYGFTAGGGFPDHINTVAILPFENQTTRFELTQELHQALLRDLPRALGVRNAGEDVADAVVRGSIRRYDLTAPLYRPGGNTGQGAEVLQRQVTIAIEVEIVNVVDNQILYEDGGISAQGQYLEETETEEVGRAEAIDLLVQRIVDGAQSNW